MDQLPIANVSVRVVPRLSPGYYRQMESRMRQAFDLPGLVLGAGTHGEAWARKMADAEAPRFAEAYARVQLEGGQVRLRARGTIATVGDPLQTYAIHIADGQVTRIEGGGGGQ
jgi:hypothetical protein